MKVLIVEDDDRISDFLVRGLHAEGIQIDLAKTGDDGFLKAVSQSFDVIVLDLMLPGMDGREVCKALRAQGNTTKILMLTALESTSDIVHGLRIGADDYLSKPFAFEELLARLNVLARSTKIGKQPLQNDVLTCGHLRFDLKALKVSYAETPIVLTSLEYSLLEYLMKEQGKVISRTLIIENVWGVQEDPMTNIVDVYIRRLRRKLEAAGMDGAIATIRGRGYRMTERHNEGSR